MFEESRTFLPLQRDKSFSKKDISDNNEFPGPRLRRDFLFLGLAGYAF